MAEDACDHRLLASGLGLTPHLQPTPQAHLQAHPQPNRQATGAQTDALTAFERFADEVTSIARAAFRREPVAHTLQPTAVVSEVWLRLAQGVLDVPADRVPFLAYAARLVRAVLVDHARARRAQRRGGDWQRIPLEELTFADGLPLHADILDLEDALVGLAAIDERLARVAEQRVYGGLEMREIADLNGIGLSTAELDWRKARLWLQSRLTAA
jgi:RNA polymerase sigma factor (TIGR02999 family)